MGYIVLKNTSSRRGEETFRVSDKGIHFSSALKRKIGLDKKAYRVVIMIDSDTRKLCMDFKDGDYPDSYPVNLGRSNAIVYSELLVREYNVPKGLYRFEKKDGSVYVSNCIVKK